MAATRRIFIAIFFLVSLTLIGQPRISAAPLDPVQQIAAGWGHTCALVGSGNVYCWGMAVLNGTERNTTAPALVKGISKVKAISAGLVNTCAIDQTDRGWCWGTDWKATMESKSLVKSHTPKLIDGLPAVTKIAIGYSHVCAILKSDGSVWCWGSNGVGELGNGTTAETAMPVRAGSISGAISISAGVGSTCAAVAAGEVYCWGTDHRQGGVIVKSNTPVKIEGLKNVTKVVNGRNFFCTLTVGREVICFGSNIFMQLGNKAAGDRYAAPLRTKVGAATDIATNLFSACAVLKTKKVSCWGVSLPGQGKYGSFHEPTQVALLSEVKSVVLGLSYACALLHSGRIKCWGDNSGGYLGDGQTSKTPVIKPVEVVGLP